MRRGEKGRRMEVLRNIVAKLTPMTMHIDCHVLQQVTCVCACVLVKRLWNIIYTFTKARTRACSNLSG